MEFNISITIDEKAKHKSHLIVDLSEALKEYFRDKNYGEDIKDYVIGCICTLPPEGFEKFNTPKKPTYVDYKKTKNIYTGEEHTMNKLFINRFNFNSDEYEEFISVSDEESKKILENKIIKSLENLDELPKKVKDFDKEQFKKDLLAFLK
ncbi:hypothetical protein PG326_02870 [Riemerella anatipestifer]|nr:hypothetical protein [Riemerella anatipestifer]MDY3357279.1 hypothetical protein [Riemerella anatipestifer]